MRLQERIDEQARRAELADAYAPVCEAAGFLTGEVFYQPEDLLFLAHKIWGALEAAGLCEKFRTYDKTFPSAFSTDYVALLESMTDAARAELRSQIRFEPTPLRRKK
jgi:hypothetical protein